MKCCNMRVMYIFFLPETPVDGNVVIQQHIRQAPLGAVLCDDTDIWHLDRAANELAEVRMIQLPEDKMIINTVIGHASKLHLIMSPVSSTSMFLCWVALTGLPSPLS